jgi:hypothetical protein
MKRFHALLVAALMFAGIATSGAAFAAKASVYAPTLTTTMSADGGVVPHVSGETAYVVSGCGYNAAYGGVTIVVNEPGAVAFAGEVPGGDSCISLSNFSTQGAGSYTIDAWQHIGKKDVKVASTSFSVS